MRHAKKQQPGDGPCEHESSPVELSQAELAVFKAFRRYLMTPGKMLCFSAAEIEAYEVPLKKLTRQGLLVAERFQGGYSLTTVGFAAMKQCA